MYNKSILQIYILDYHVKFIKTKKLQKFIKYYIPEKKKNWLGK